MRSDLPSSVAPERLLESQASLRRVVREPPRPARTISMGRFRRPIQAAPLAGVVVALGFGLSACSSPQADLHSVRWKDVAVPGSTCGSFQPRVQLHRGQGFAISHRWPPYSIVEFVGAWDRVVYGDLDGDGNDEAAVGVYCSNGGGTADAVLAYALVIYTANAGTPRVLGVIRPRAQSQLPALIRVTRIGRGTIRVSEAFYGSNDGTCCPSGRAVTTWALRNGDLVPVTTTILKSAG
jgi:hypothetical protein